MFEYHRKSPWFAEKYDPAPELEKLRTRVRKEGWKGRLNNFLHDLESGNFDPDLREPEPEPVSPTKENGNGEAADGHAPTEETKPAPSGDDEMQFNVEADDDAGDHDAQRNDTNGKSYAGDKRGNHGEEISVPTEGNQVMIRTIPPDIGRVKLEEVVLLSLSNFVILMFIVKGMFENPWFPAPGFRRPSSEAKLLPSRVAAIPR